MMKLKVVLCLVLGLFCYWFPVQHGHCSEQKPETQMQTQALASQDIRNHHKKSKKNRGNNEVELVVTEGDLLQDDIGLTVLESSSPQKQDASIRFIDINPVTDLSFRVSESVSCRDSPATDTDTALITDPSLIGCDSTEDRQYDGHVNSFPVVQENIDVHKTGKFTKVSKDLTGQATNASHIRKEQGANVTPEIESSLPCKDQEEIPTFDEWTKIMMEVENEKSQVTHISNRIPGSSKKVQQTVTNYASVECGAKILSSNPQAKSTSAVLMENMDMYMLNPCNNKIWFVIELCQPIQVKQLDIANFEIFSSNPKDFVVLISNRYPTNKWVNLGTFHASDTRTVQSFPLDDHLFARYVKVELLSHFGSEHFCPLSLIRVFGTSMMEEYEIHSEPSESRHFQDDDNDQPPDLVPLDDKTSKNLIGSAKDAILTMVNNIAASVLGGNPENGSEDRGNCSSGDSKMAKKSLIPPSIHITESTVPVLADINKIIETTITQETALKGVIPASSASLPEASTIERPVEDVPFQSTPEVELIVTLLSDDEDESSSEQKLEKSKSDQQNSLVKESTVFSESPCSCSHVCTFQEYFLHHWSSQLFIQKRTRKSDLCCQHFISPQNKQSTLAIMIQSITQQVQTPMTEKPTLSENPITSSHQVLPVPKTESSHECGPVDLASSLTSDLLKPISAGCPSCQATQTIVLASPECLKSKASQPRIEKLIEPSMKPLPSILSELTGTTGILEDHCQISLTMVQSSPDNDISALTILKNKVDSSQLSSSSTSVDQPIHKLLKNKVVTGGTVPLTQPINPLDESVPSAETKSKELLDDVIPEGNTNIEQSSSEIYAGTHNSTGIQVHGSSQKESVFMRLNNRIKVLEMNMSLSGRYLEQLSQRYRKQVEEMQRAFNKTLIKLQNTSRIAEEQDHRQTDSIQMLQEQLDNITQLILNLSVSVSQLQREVSGRESYILLCLVLCALLGLLICLNHSQMSAESLPVESVSFHCPVRNSSEYIDTDLRHRAFDQLSQSSFQIPVAKADLEEATNVKQWEHAPGGTEKKQKLNFKKGPEKLSSSVLTNQSSASGFPRTTTRLHTLNLRLLSDESGPPVVTKDVISEDGCEKSSQSLETMFCGIPTCGCLCESLSGPKCCKEKKAYNHLLTPFSTTTEHLHQAVVTQCSPATEHRDTKLS